MFDLTLTTRRVLAGGGILALLAGAVWCLCRACGTP